MRPPSATSDRRSPAVPRQFPGPEDWDEEFEYEDDEEDEPKRSKKNKKKKKKKSKSEKDEKDEKKPVSPLWTKLLVICGSVLIVLSLGVMVTAKVLLNKAASSISTVEIGGSDSVVVSGKALDGSLNILLVGVDDGTADGIGGDHRTDTKDGVRADSIMILHLPPKHDHGYIASIPRDTWVKIPAYPKSKFGGGSGKINSAFMAGYGDPSKGGPGNAGGLDLLMQTIYKETGITFNAAAIVNFTGFTAAVKLLGGVTMYIDEKVTSVHYGKDKYGNYCVPATFDGNMIAHPISACKGRVYEKGTRRLTAEEALDYTRQREWMEMGDGDYGRQRHQQQFIKALVREAKAQGLTTNLPKALNLISAVGSTMTMWTNGAKVEDWFFTLKDMAGSEITMIKTNRGTYNSAEVEGTSAEGLSPQSRQMFTALRDEKIDEWLIQNPEWLGTDSLN
jgi:anionic cell wall polymer biosynthesis LytR-Cps2A-Psr (LCP) family protein